MRALVHSGGRVSGAARSLGLSRATLDRRIRPDRIDLAAYAEVAVSD